MSTTVECPKCSRGIPVDEYNLAVKHTCPECGTSFVPNDPSVTFPPDNPPTDQPEWVELQSKAGTMSFLAGLLAIGCGVFCLAIFFTGNVLYGGIAGTALAAALWLYQAAQLLHIRALLSKRDSEPPRQP